MFVISILLLACTIRSQETTIQPVSYSSTPVGRISPDVSNGNHWNDSSADTKRTYYILVDEYSDVEVSKELWEELLGRLQETYSETPVPASFEELFEGIYEQQQNIMTRRGV